MGTDELRQTLKPYQRGTQSLQRLAVLVHSTEVAGLTEDMLENTWREIDYRLDVLLATKGAHVEMY